MEQCHLALTDQLDFSAPYAGAAYVFTRAGGSWTQEAYLKASNTETYDEFGWSVGILENTIVVGARWESSATAGVDGDQSNNKRDLCWCCIRICEKWKRVVSTGFTSKRVIRTRTMSSVELWPFRTTCSLSALGVNQAMLQA
ncbi:MAG: FG-GAP repeat protein [Flavobacteriales bacterium]|nr:FG-GAP repeat protein [Flavobacteriales bacterium]